MEAPFDRGQGPEGAVTSHTCMMDGRIPIFVDIGQTDLHVIFIYPARVVCDITI
jgi:hypothetical protein